MRATSPLLRAPRPRAPSRGRSCPVPAGPMPNVTVRVADRVDVALLRHGLRRDLLAAVAPDDVVEDVLRRSRPGRSRRRTASTVAGPISWPRLDQLDELVDDRARLGDVDVVALRSSGGSRAGRIVHSSRSRSASRTPSPIAASSAATSFGDVEEVSLSPSCTRSSCAMARPLRASGRSSAVEASPSTSSARRLTETVGSGRTTCGSVRSPLCGRRTSGAAGFACAPPGLYDAYASFSLTSWLTTEPSATA